MGPHSRFWPADLKIEMRLFTHRRWSALICVALSMPLLAAQEESHPHAPRNRIGEFTDCSDALAQRSAIQPPSFIHGYAGPDHWQPIENRGMERKQLDQTRHVYEQLLRGNVRVLRYAMANNEIRSRYEYLVQNSNIQVGTVDWATFGVMPSAMTTPASIGVDSENRLALGMNIYWWEQDPNLTFAEQITFLYVYERFKSSEHNLIQQLEDVGHFSYAWDKDSPDGIHLIFWAYAELSAEIALLTAYKEWRELNSHPELRVINLEERVSQYVGNPYAYAHNLLNQFFMSRAPGQHHEGNGLVEAILERPMPRDWKAPWIPRVRR